jgi:nitrite reductase (NO-forming)
VFANVCAACHQPGGTGVAGVFPPLAGSDFLNADKTRAIGVVVQGLSGEITVNGKTYNSQMPSPDLSDEDIANALTFVYSSWGNAGHEVKPSEVAAVRAAKKAGGK